jgi:hypothetical protein
MIAFRNGPLAAYATAHQLAGSATGLAPEDAKKALTAAIDQFRKCQKDTTELMVDYPRIASIEFVLDRKKLQVKAMLSICGDAAKSVETQLTVVKARLALYETGHALEKARTLLTRADRSTDMSTKRKAWGEALGELESCVEKGRILQYRNAELKSEALDVGGERLTLPVIVDACHKDAKVLRAKLDVEISRL